jgi:hypothetical protein
MAASFVASLVLSSIATQRAGHAVSCLLKPLPRLRFHLRSADPV